MSVGGLLLFDDSDAGRCTAGRRFGGLSLLERGIRTMVRAGVRRLLVVTPAHTSVAVSRTTRHLEVDLEFVEWGQRPDMVFRAGQEVLCLLGDHTHHHASLTSLVSDGMGAADLVLQVTTASQSLPLLRPQIEGGTLRFESGHEGDQVSTGAFLIDGSLAPHEIVTAGTCPTDFLSQRAAGRSLRTVAGQAHLWRRVVDRASARAARDMLFSQVTKSTSGPVSRHINARISIPISKGLIETGISPHMVTVLFVMTTGLSAAYLMSHPMPYWRLALAGVLWQMAAVLDRCDGEIARVKLCESQFGAWFDTLTDNIAYLCAYGAFLLAVTKVHPDQPLYLYAGLCAVGALLLTLAIMYNYALKTGNGSLQKYLVGLARVPESEKGWLYRLLERNAFIAKRDFFAFVHFVFALLNQFDLIYLYSVVGLHLLALGVIISQRKMLASHRRRAPLAEPVTVAAAAPSAQRQGA